jgi:hypothetical protein
MAEVAKKTGSAVTRHPDEGILKKRKESLATRADKDRQVVRCRLPLRMCPRFI